MLNIGLLVVLVFVGGISAAHAQEKYPNGITVVPSITHVDFATDASEYLLTYYNNTNVNINLTLSVKDFTELEESYKISFLEGKDASNYKYSLSSWISFENKNIELSPKESKSVKVFINKSRVTKGGHYASILAEIVQPDTNKQVDVKAVLSSLLFVRASTGKEIENGKINSFRPNRDGLEFPDAFSVRFENNGNVHVSPHGLIEIYDPFGKLVGKGIINEASSDSLPESIRRFDTPIQRFSKILVPGIYSAKVQLRYGKSDKKISSSTKFFSQGSVDFVKIGLALITGVIILVYYKRRFKKSASH